MDRWSVVRSCSSLSFLSIIRLRLLDEEAIHNPTSILRDVVLIVVFFECSSTYQQVTPNEQPPWRMKSIRANPQIQDIIQKFNQKYSNYGSSNANNNGAVASAISKRNQRLNNHNGQSKKVQSPSSTASNPNSSSQTPTNLLHYSATTLDAEETDPPERGPLPSEVKQNNLLLIQKPGDREKNKKFVLGGFEKDTATKSNTNLSGSGWRNRCFKRKLDRKEPTQKVPIERDSLPEPTSCSCSEADEVDQSVTSNPKCWCEVRNIQSSITGQLLLNMAPTSSDSSGVSF